MNYQFAEGDKVRVIRNIRDDGTYPGAKRGDMLVRRGSIGYVQDTGTFLLDQIIYAVHFIEEGKVIGCREEELIGGDELWSPSQFEFRDKVKTKLSLAVDDKIVAKKGEIGEIMKVWYLPDETVEYNVYFEDQPVLRVPERVLELAYPNEQSN